ncbi:tryparedoxin-like protein [Novymonas esmeraldas]|uniref:protein-disulfide reductase n=1 Tax=Novymonas esmeraldas TaxID=1808958 RepID=A0AAW0F489_9TRYP
MPFHHRDAPFLSQFPDLKLLRQDGTSIAAAEALRGKKYVLIYFSAHWCPPCQRFTPLLADFYEAHKDTQDFEVLFVSSDREEGRMMDFFQNRSSNYVRRQPAAAASPPLPEDEPGDVGCDISSHTGNDLASEVSRRAGGGEAPQPRPPTSSTMTVRRGPAANSARAPRATGHGNWLALPFKEHDVARYLSRAYSVVSIPKVVVVAVDTSCMVTREGKMMVMKDPDAARFPWRFAEGDMRCRTEGGRECAALVLVLLCGLYYYFWYY